MNMTREVRRFSTGCTRKRLCILGLCLLLSLLWLKSLPTEWLASITYFQENSKTLPNFSEMSGWIGSDVLCRNYSLESTTLCSSVSELVTASIPYFKTNSELLLNFSEMSAWIGSDILPASLYSNYSLENTTLCSSVNDLLMLVAVNSAAANFDNRMSFRKTWTNKAHTASYGRTVIVFIVGKTDSGTQKRLQEEFSRYGDILQGGFMDTYNNLTEKGVVMHKWISERCRNAKIILKADDDIVVNIFKLYKNLVPFLHGQSRTVVCRTYYKKHINRQKSSKWYVGDSIFPQTRHYPLYCVGSFVLMTNDMPPLLYEATKTTPFLVVDDVYHYGLLFKRIQGIKVRRLKNTTYTEGKRDPRRGWNPTACKNVIVAVNVRGTLFQQCWNEIVANTRDENLPNFLDESLQLSKIIGNSNDHGKMN